MHTGSTVEQFLREAVSRKPRVVLVEVIQGKLLDPDSLLRQIKDRWWETLMAPIRAEAEERWEVPGVGRVVLVAPKLLTLRPGDRRHYPGAREIALAIAKADPRMGVFKWGREYFLRCPMLDPPEVEPPVLMTLSFWLTQRADFFNTHAVSPAVPSPLPPR